MASSPLSSVYGALQVQARVIGALILRDMRTRFGRSYFSYVIQVGWPLSHLTFMAVLYYFTRKIVPLGTDLGVFVTTGLLPYILCFYPARFIMISVGSNATLLNFPIVKAPDLIIARAILEMITAFSVFILFTTGVAFLDVNVIPPDPATAIIAVFATLYFAFSLGFFSAVMYGIWFFFLPVQILSLIGMFAASNLVLLPAALSPTMQNLLWYNPLFQCVEWLRSAYYQDFDPGLLSPTYLLGLSTFLLFSGLFWERLTRGKLLA